VNAKTSTNSLKLFNQSVLITQELIFWKKTKAMFKTITSFILLTVFSINQVFAEAIPLDRVVTIVNDDVVLESEVEGRLKSVRDQIRERNSPLPPEHVLTQQVLERLILESIQLQIGERSGVRIDDTTLNDTMRNIAKKNGLSLSDFKKELEQDGVSFREAREQIRREMIINRVRQRRVSDRVQVTDTDIQNYLDSDLGKTHTAAEFRIAHIFIPLPENASLEDIDKKEQQANTVYEQLMNGVDFKQLAITSSAGPTALEGGDLGWKQLGQLPTLFAEKAVDMQPDSISKPLKNNSGFHLIKLLDKRGGKTQMVGQTHVRHILIKPSEIRSAKEAERLAQLIYDKIESGSEFEELAKAFSNDKGSSQQGGDLDWVGTGETVPEFENVMNNTKVNEIAFPFKSEFGWHVLQVLGHRKQDIGEQMLKNQARHFLRKRKFDEELQDWLREIREEAYVEIKL